MIFLKVTDDLKLQVTFSIKMLIIMKVIVSVVQIVLFFEKGLLLSLLSC